MVGSKFCKQFLQKVTKGTFLWNYFKIWPAVSEKIFLRISSCSYSARSPHSPEPCFGQIKFHEQFLKRVTQRTFLWNYFKIGPAVPEEKIFKELLKKFNFIAMATRVFDGIKFCQQFLKRTSQRTFLQSLVQIGPVVWEEKMFKKIADDAQRTMDTSPP